MKKRFFKISLIIIIGYAFILFTDYLGFFEGINNYLYDLSFRLRGSIKHDERILIAAIDEKTLSELGKWPLKRTYYSNLLDSLNEASAIGLDIIFSEASEDDLSLAESIKRLGKVVLPVYVTKTSGVSRPSEVFSFAKTGHIHVEPDTDEITRKVFHHIIYDNNDLYSFASVIYNIVLGKEFSSRFYDAKDNILKQNKIFQADLMNINFYGPSGTFEHISFVDIIENNYEKDFFRNKIVLVGLTASGLEDRLIVPFTQQRDTMPGVEVHANILNNLLDKNFITIIDEKISWFLSIIISSALFLLFIKIEEKKSAVLLLVTFCLISLLTYMFFIYFHFWIRPFVLFTSLCFVFITSYFLKLDEAVKKLDSKYISINEKLGNSLDTTKEKITPSGFVSFLTPKSINVKVNRLINLENKYEDHLETIVKQRTEDLSKALLMINEMSNEMIMRLTKAAESRETGTGEHILRIGMYAREIAKYLKMSEEFVELITFASPMHDIGKIGIPDNILLKKSELNTEEFDIMKTHTVIGEKILSGSLHPKIVMSSSIALNHHEKWDGTGYPRGLKGSDIPIEARIVMICDVYDAMRSVRPYKPAFDHKTTLKIITEGDDRLRPNHFDPEVLEAFLKISSVFEDIYKRYKDSSLVI